MTPETHFPKLREEGHRVTSPATISYNCIAWAAGDQFHRWDPDTFGIYYWPSGVPRRFDVPTLIAMFEDLGYHSCKDGSLELGIEKVVIYCTNEGRPQHMARQLPAGKWTSKLGDFEDIEHALEGLNSPDYGSAVHFMSRPTGAT